MSNTKTAELRWVKAKDRLPERNGDYPCRVLWGNGKMSGYYIYNFNSVSQKFFDEVGVLDTNSVVWLEETLSLPSQPIPAHGTFIPNGDSGIPSCESVTTQPTETDGFELLIKWIDSQPKKRMSRDLIVAQILIHKEKHYQPSHSISDQINHLLDTEPINFLLVNAMRILNTEQRQCLIDALQERTPHPTDNNCDCPYCEFCRSEKAFAQLGTKPSTTSLERDTIAGEAWDAAIYYANECFCDKCDYCLEVKPNMEPAIDKETYLSNLNKK